MKKLISRINNLLKSNNDFLKTEYWTEEKLEKLPVLPIIEIDFGDGGTISKYDEFREISETWNHFLFEPLIDEKFQTFFIDSNQELFTIQYHKEKFKYPKYISKLDKNTFLELLKRSKLENSIDYKLEKTPKEMFDRLLKMDFNKK